MLSASYLPVSRCSQRSSHGTVLTGQACLEPDARETCLPAASPLLPSQLAGAARVPRAEGAPSCSLHARRASRPPLLSCLPNLAGAPSCSTHARRAPRPPLFLHLLNLAGVPRARRTHIFLTRQALSLLRANRRPARAGLTRVRLPHRARAARHTGRREPRRSAVLMARPRQPFRLPRAPPLATSLPYLLYLRPSGHSPMTPQPIWAQPNARHTLRAARPRGEPRARNTYGRRGSTSLPLAGPL